MAPSKPATRTLLVTTAGGRSGGQFKLTIPASAKVTFSGTNPQHPTHGSATLRIYETEKLQLAVFTNVVEFRDLSLNLERIITATDEEFVDNGTGTSHRKTRKTKFAIREEF